MIKYLLDVMNINGNFDNLIETYQVYFLVLKFLVFFSPIWNLTLLKGEFEKLALSRKLFEFQNNYFGFKLKPFDFLFETYNFVDRST